MSAPIPIYQVDAFVSQREFSGNPAGVCMLPAPRDERWMQSVAQEMNLSETAFLTKNKEGFDLRWFTPTVEVDLCGHATLASSHVLWEMGYLAPGEQARFFTKSGLLTADLTDGLIEMDFPALPAREAALPPEILEGLAVSALYTGTSQFDFLVEVESEDVVRALKPNFDILGRVGVRGIIVTCRSTTAGFDFISRFFAPGSGINEDPVTGSAHSCLGPYWHTRLKKHAMIGYQASPRGGVVRVRMEGDRVMLGGNARTFFKAELAGR